MWVASPAILSRPIAEYTGNDDLRRDVSRRASRLRSHVTTLLSTGRRCGDMLLPSAAQREGETNVVPLHISVLLPDPNADSLHVSGLELNPITSSCLWTVSLGRLRSITMATWCSSGNFCKYLSTVYIWKVFPIRMLFEYIMKDDGGLAMHNS